MFFSSFKYESVPLKDILLDDRNPRLVTQTKLPSQKAILTYLYEHEALADLIQKIASEGRNQGAERPYVIKAGANYIVLEGNRRIAAYKVLTGLLAPPAGHSAPHVTQATLASLANVDCAVAPDRGAVMPIMVSAHFGLGDKARWGYLGSRKAVYDEWKVSKNLVKVAKEFDLTLGEARNFVIEYLLYQKALSLSWTKNEKEELLKPGVAFNPPVRFLETKTHKEKMGISYDTANLKVVFASEADKKFKHLLKKLVISPVKGLGATATYEEVFADYGASGTTTKPSGGGTSSGGAGGKGSSAGTAGGGGSTKPQKKSNALFAYEPTITNALVVQLMKEAKDIDSKRFPACATFLLRNVVESVLKHIIDDQKANSKGLALDLEGALNLCMSNAVSLPVTDKKILTQFKKDHVTYLNLGAHGNIIPNTDRVAAARDCIDQFIKKYV